MVLSDVTNIAILVLNGFGKLMLVSLGLAIIFGMMGVINLAHGEFIMIGAYTTAYTFNRGVPLALGILIAGVVTGIVGLLVERLVVRHLYGRIEDSLVATWGVSLIILQTMLLLFGSRSLGIQTPMGEFQIAGVSGGVYKLVLTGVAIVLLGLTYFLFMYTEYGLQARATMQNEEMARSIGTNTNRIYVMTFFYGSFVTGVAGGLLAPTLAIIPTLGQSVIIEAFVTVIVGGSAVLLGTSASSFLLAFINGAGVQLGGPLIGRVALLLTAIVVLRVFPGGVSDYIREKLGGSS